MSVQLDNLALNQPSTQISGELRCALTGKVISADEAYWAPPLITAGALIRTIVMTSVRTPSNLGHILFDEQANVPYAADVRQELGSRRTMEQLKLLVFLLLVAGVIFAPIFFLSMR